MLNKNIKEKNAAGFQANFKNYMGNVHEGMQEMQNKIHAEYMRRYSTENNEQSMYSSDMYEGTRPLTTDLGFHRILRTSTLKEVPEVCCTE